MTQPVSPKSPPHTDDDSAPTDPVPAPGSAALDALVQNHRAFLAFLERRVGNRATAEDLLQHAFVRGLDKLPQLRDQESAVAWFYRVLRNAVIDHHRSRGAAARGVERLAQELGDAVEPPPEVRALACRCVLDLAGALKPEYAQALQAVEVDGQSLAAYARDAGITANNAGVRVHRAREALRRQVSISCGTCATHGCLDCSCGGPDPQPV